MISWIAGDTDPRVTRTLSRQHVHHPDPRNRGVSVCAAQEAQCHVSSPRPSARPRIVVESSHRFAMLAWYAFLRSAREGEAPAEPQFAPAISPANNQDQRTTDHELFASPTAPATPPKTQYSPTQPMPEPASTLVFSKKPAHGTGRAAEYCRKKSSCATFAASQNSNLRPLNHLAQFSPKT